MPTPLLQPGEPTKLFDGESAAPPTNSVSHAMPTTFAKVLTWSTSFASAPSASVVELQVSNDGTVWTVLDTATDLLTGATRTSAVTNAAFVRARRVSQTGGGNLTVTVILGY